MTVRPRRIVHSGRVLASGMAVSTALCGEAAARARLLRLPRCEVFRAGGFLIARFPEPVRLDAAEAPGTPLVRIGNLLSMAPLEPDEVTALDAAEDTAVLAAGSAVSLAVLRDEIREDVALWLDVSGFALLDELQPLGAVHTEARNVLPNPAAVREALGMGPMAASSEELLQALIAGRTGAAKQPARRSSAVSRLLALSGGLLGLLAGGFLNLSGRRTASPAAGTGNRVSSSAIHPGPAGIPRPSLLFRLQALAARMLWSPPLAGLMRNQHARHLSRLLDMFDSNDLEAALRHAVPLSSGLANAIRRLPMWTPQARKDLSISTQRATSGTSLSLGEDLYASLRERYRRAYERLAAAGEIEKAAFVLAELLNESEEAVQFLERHGRLRQAAEIAEGRKLAPGMVIRLWFLAGERARAIRIARLTGAFSDAIVRLETSHKGEAAALRVLWANTLAAGGHYGAAVDAIWPVEEARRLAAAWIDRAIEAGGLASARMLARKLRLLPSSFPEVLERSEALLTADGEEEQAMAAEYARELIAGQMSAGERVQARNLLKRTAVSKPAESERAVLADYQRELQAAGTMQAADKLLARAAARHLLARADGPSGTALMQRLTAACGDPVFQADARTASLRGWPPPQPETPLLKDRAEPLEIGRTWTDAGNMRIHDAAILPRGRMLIAAGEAGVLLLSRDGKILKRFAEPAEHIVISDQADRAILVARRGEVCRLSRLDTVREQVRGWCDAAIDRFAPDFDGLTWFTARQGAVDAIDATATHLERLWTVREDDAVACTVSRDAASMSVLFDLAVRTTVRRREIWTYELPSLTLRRRQEIGAGEEHFPPRPISPGGGFAGRKDSEQPDVWLYNAAAWTNMRVNEAGGPFPPALTNEWLALPVDVPGGTLIHLVDCAGKQVRARISLDGAGNSCRIRLQGGHLIVSGAAGRVLALSLKTGAVICEHRLSV